MAKDLVGTLSWANNAAAGTVQTLVGEEHSHDPGAAILYVHNPGAVAITVQPQLRWTDSGDAARDADLGAALAVPAGGTKAQRVEGFGMGRPVIRATNDAAVGLSGAFTAQVRVEFLG